MLHDNFIKKIEQESPEFKAIMNILDTINVKANNGRKLLCLVDQLIDYYIVREIEDESDVKMPIIYFPLCEEWAQSLCEEFVALKMSLFWGNKTRCNLFSSHRPFVYIPEGAGKKEIIARRQQYAFKCNVIKNINSENISIEANENKKCFLYSRNISDKLRHSSLTKGYYYFCQDIMDENINSENSLVLLGEDEDELYNDIEENDGKIKVPNIFLFLQKDLDGRNTKLCMRMQRTTINEYNEDYDTGINNVFFFIFSQKTYRLHRIYETKHNLVERLQREKIVGTKDFISFTKDEMNYLFDRKKENVSFFNLECDKVSEQYQIKLAFDTILQDIPHEVKFRNELAICFTEQCIDKIKNDIIEQNPEVNIEYVDYFLQVLHEKYNQELKTALYKWISFNQVAVVLDYNVDTFFKDKLKLYLQTECGATSVNFYTFKNFRAHKENGILKNSINEDRILVLSMLNHCTGRSWSIYPNSFDQYHLNLGQSVLQVNNKLVFEPRFSWYGYRYAEQLKFLLNSDFRNKYLKATIHIPVKPENLSIEPKDDEDEQNIRNRQACREQKKVTVSFGARQHHTFFEDELVLCKCMDEFEIYSVMDLYRLFDDSTDIEIKPLSDFYQHLELFIYDKDKAGDAESIMRNNVRYGLSEEEKTSKVEMWKILLEHRVSDFGEVAVYEDIMRPLSPMDRIQLNSFRRWLDHSDGSILPRSRRMQKRVLEEYLQIENLYTRMLRHRKSRMCTNTEGKNEIFRTFLTHCLLQSDSEIAYKSLSHEVRDYLNIVSGDDIKDIIDLIKEEMLQLRSIKSIKYD